MSVFSDNQDESGSFGRGNEINHEVADYLRMARSAIEAGRFKIGVYLYLAAFEQDCRGQSTPTPATLAGLRKAWSHAIDLKDRALSEHIFEMLEPYSDSDTVAEYSRKLQALALEKLEEFGFSSSEVEQMADILSDEFSAGGGELLAQLGQGMMISAKPSDHHDLSDSNPKITTVDASLVLPSSPFDKAMGRKGIAVSSSSSKDVDKGEKQSEDFIHMPAYEDLIGYDSAIEEMKAYGIGMSNDERFKSFLEMLSRRHGIASVPSAQTLVFRSAAREDATHFMHATVGELNLPSVRMYMETTSQGVSMLCVMASTDFKSRYQFMQTGFDKPAVLVLEDIDLWTEPFSGIEAEAAANPANQMAARGAKEAIALVRSAVENPNVTVLASCSIDASASSLFFGLLEPTETVDIDLPSREERAAVWKDVVSLYPSLRYLDMEDLVRLSESLTRSDIYAAAREAVEQAYKESINKHAFVPVTSASLHEKIAAYQPLESDQFKEIEEEVIESFRKDLDRLDDLLNGDQ